MGSDAVSIHFQGGKSIGLRVEAVIQDVGDTDSKLLFVINVFH